MGTKQTPAQTESNQPMLILFSKGFGHIFIKLTAEEPRFFARYCRYCPHAFTIAAPPAEIEINTNIMADVNPLTLVHPYFVSSLINGPILTASSFLLDCGTVRCRLYSAVEGVLIIYQYLDKNVYPFDPFLPN